MAIKVSGTTVVDDSRNLQNLVNLNTSGNVYANTFVGDADQLTNLPASGGSFEATASGTLSDGSTVVVNTDGTVSVVGFSDVEVSQTLGSPVQFESGSTYWSAAAYDPTSNQVVVVYSDGGNSSYSTFIVGSISGSTINFGTATVFDSYHGNHYSISFDQTTSTCVIAFKDGGRNNYGNVIVGVVFGPTVYFTGSLHILEYTTCTEFTSIYTTGDKWVVSYVTSSGSRAKVVTATGSLAGSSTVSSGSVRSVDSNPTDRVTCAYDPDNDKVVFVYHNAGSGTSARAKVGTISGTTISVGSATDWGPRFMNMPQIVYDTVNNKFVVFYQDGNDGDKGKAIVGTVSGTSISFGSITTFFNSNVDGLTGQPAFDPLAGKVVFLHTDVNNATTRLGTLSIGTVSGTSISFETPVTIGASVEYVSLAYDANAKKIAVIYGNVSSSTRGTGRTFELARTDQVANITSENFIGISDGAYANNTTATIQIKGAVDDAQSGLTPGQQYFVQANGSINTTAADPSVFAGTAIASNKLIVKG